MKGLRTVSVLEHEVIPVIGGGSVDDDADLGSLPAQYLMEADANALIELNSLRAGLCQRVSGGVKVAQHCGIVRLDSCVLEILPKVGMNDARGPDEVSRSRAALLTMLHSARKIKITSVSGVPQLAVRAPLLDVFVEAFLNCALDQVRRGLLCRYVAHADDLPVIRGRFHAHEHIRRNMGRPHLLHCEYDEFTADNAYNRAIRATLDACRTWASRASTQRLWFETHARYASIESVRASSGDVAGLLRERTTQRYEPVLMWCELLLALNSPAIAAGSSRTPGLLFDMNKLFEAHVSGLEEASADDGQIVYRQGPEMALANQAGVAAFTLKPDLTVWRAARGGSEEQIERVIDAKWKRLDPDASYCGVEQDDVYQLLAYAVRYRCRQLELVYPAVSIGAGNEVTAFEIPNVFGGLEDVQVRIRTVPLGP